MGKRKSTFGKRFIKELKGIGGYPQANLAEEIYKSYKTKKISPWLKGGKKLPRSTKPLKRLKKELRL